MIGYVITLATSKGGTGKSTLTRNIAAYWLNIGIKVAVIDADPQGSIINRHNLMGDLKNLTIIAAPEEDVSSVITRLKREYNYIIVDTGGFKNRTTVKALISSNLVLIPLKPSADDLIGALDTYHLIQELNKTPERISIPIKYRMIITMSQQNTIIAKHVRTELEQLGYLLLKSEMYHRVAYPESVINNSSPCISDRNGLAARDIDNIVKELIDCL